MHVKFTDAGLERLTGVGYRTEGKEFVFTIYASTSSGCFSMRTYTIFSHPSEYHLCTTRYKPSNRLNLYQTTLAHSDNFHFFGYVPSARHNHTLYRQTITESMLLSLRVQHELRD